MRRRRHLAVRSAAAVAAVGLAAFLAAQGIIRWRDQSVSNDVARYDAIISRCAAEQGLPPDLVRSVVRVESGGDPRAVSRTGARGLMQLMPDAERDALKRLRIAPGDLFDPEYNVRVGCAYLRLMLERFDGDVYLAVAAYNAGPTRMADTRRNNPDLTGRQVVEQFAPAETRAYCVKVIGGRWGRLNLPRRP